ncbi:MFS transporter [Streptomyces sp. NPDC001982]|uniref:MFS transporter n=1 Tax=Streptomyces sp. NPDC001982 TaxID=3154405 RepID=UPI00331B7E6A
MKADGLAQHEYAKPEGGWQERTYRKISWRLFPIIISCYFVAFLDRTNIGIAKLQMDSELGLSEAAYGLGAGLFFIGYVLLEVPSNLYMYKIGAKRTISRIMVLWGIVATCFMFVHSPAEYYGLRLLLGACEAGFFPGIILYLTYWFPSDMRARAIGIFIVAQPVSGLVGGPLGGWILKSLNHVDGFSGWKWLFLIEGLPSIILGVAVIWLLTDTPQKAKWLTQREKDLVLGELDRDRELKKSFTSHSLGDLVRDKYVILLVFLVFAESMGLYGLSFWLPTLVKNAGVHSTLMAGVVTAAPYACGAIAMILVSRSSDRRHERKWHLSVPFCVTALGIAASVALGGNTIAALVALCLAGAGAYTVSALCWNVPPAFFSGVAAAAGIAGINALGNLGGFVSPYLIGLSQTLGGSSTLGFYILSGVLVLGAILTHLLPTDRVNR